MSNKLRQLYNSVERFFDRKALQENIEHTQKLKQFQTAITARAAFAIVLTEAKKLDNKACLKMIVAPENIDEGGTANRWEFFFDLPQCRAKLECDWYLEWDDTKDDFTHANLQVIAQPFPNLNNSIRKMVNNGELLYQSLLGLWKDEHNRQITLPNNFRDSDKVIEEIMQKGLDLSNTEVTLSTGPSPENKASWILQTRSETFYAKLT